MTASQDGPDRSAVFERDDFECQHCGAATDGAGPDSATSRTYAVDDPPDEPNEESSLVTVCDSCFAVLEGRTSRTATETSPAALFEAVRDVTRVQGQSIADVAEFASSATALPSAVESDADPGPEYTASRRSNRLTLDVVDARFDELPGPNRDALPPDAGDAFAAFLESTARLQRRLRTVVERAEAVAASLERCHACFASLEGAETDDLEAGTRDELRCPACGTSQRDVSEWADDAGTVRQDALFASVNDALRAASETTDEVTDRVTVLAALLVGE